MSDPDMETAKSPLVEARADGSVARPAPGLAGVRVTGGGSGNPTVMQCLAPSQVIGVQDSSPVAWNRDGTALAYVSGNHSIFVLRQDRSPMKLMQVAQVLNGHDASVRALIFHPKNEDVLVSGGVDGIFVWSLREGRATRVIRSEANVSPEFPAHEADVEVLAFVYGNTLVSGSKDSNIKLWDADRGFVLLETLTGHKATVLALKAHEKSHRLSSAGRDSSIKIWDISTLAPEWRARRAEDRGLKCELAGNLDGHRGDVVTLTWRSDGSGLFSGARDNTWRMWNVTTMSEVRVVEDAARGMDGSHKGDVRRIIGLPGGRHAVTAALDGTVVLWELDPEDGTEPLVSAAASAAAASGSAESKDDGAGMGAAAAASAAPVDDSRTSVTGGGAGAWDAGTAAILEQIMGGDGAELDLAAGGLSSASSDRILGFVQLFPPEEGVFCMELCPAVMRLAISTTRNTVAIFDFRPSPAELLGYDPADPATAPTGRIRVPMVQAFHGHSSTVNEVELVGDGDDRLVATAASDNRVAIYDAASTARLMALDFTASALCLAVARTPESGTLLLAGGSDYVIRAYSADHARQDALARHLHAEAAGKGDPSVDPSRYEAARYVGHAGRVMCLAAHSSGKLLVSGSADFSILLWDLTKPRPEPPAPGTTRAVVPVGRPISRLEAHMGQVTSLSFCDAALQGGDLLASGGNDHAVKVWRVTSGSLGGTTLAPVWAGNDHGDASSTGARDLAGVEAAAPHRSTVSSVRWGRGPSSGLLFSAGWDHVVSVWAAEGTGETAPLASRRLHGARVTDMDVSSTGHFLITVSADFSARQWTASAELVPIARFPCTALDGGMTSVAAGTRRFFCASDNGQIRVFPIYTPTDPASAAAFTQVEDAAQQDGSAARADAMDRFTGAVHEPVAAAAASAAGAVHSTNPLRAAGSP